MFKRVLIANRGEIAVRIASTLRKMGIKAIGVYSEADKRSAHVLACDEAIEIGPATASESYLSIPKIITAAKRSGCDAIHPGYGFLSENPEFAKTCSQNKITFMGPDHNAMKLLGNKSEAKELAAKLNIPTANTLQNANDFSRTKKWAEKVKYPILLKAIAGGGGKGMRKVISEKSLKEAIESSMRESRSSFGDDKLLAEQYIHPARHIEIQTLADSRGTVLTFPERECSLQRRHQKIIEETPSKAVDEATRNNLRDAASKLIKKSKYSGAATVEFLLDSKGNHYFLEVNTRLQVEHPVTEMITGIDLVQLQVESAAGLTLTKYEDSIYPGAHSIEARLYAEEPFNQFLPSSGRILRIEWPTHPGIRIDSGIIRGQFITSDYDPLLAKIISVDYKREMARKRLLTALKQIFLAGVGNNLSFLIKLLESKYFRNGMTFTHTVDDNINELIDEIIPTPLLLLTALSHSEDNATSSTNRITSSDKFSPWFKLGSWKR